MWLFFIFWICSNIFRDFLGCRLPIFKCVDIIRFVIPLAFQRCIPNCFTIKTREATAKRKRKVENDVSAFLHFWIRSNIFRNFSGSRSPIFNCFYIIRFVFPFAFQRQIVLLQKLVKLWQKKTQSRKRWQGGGGV